MLKSQRRHRFSEKGGGARSITFLCLSFSVLLEHHGLFVFLLRAGLPLVRQLSECGPFQGGDSRRSELLAEGKERGQMAVDGMSHGCSMSLLQASV